MSERRSSADPSATWLVRILGRPIPQTVSRPASTRRVGRDLFALIRHRLREGSFISTLRRPHSAALLRTTWCSYCGRPMTNIDTRTVRRRPTDRTLDHIVPVSLGGRRHDNAIDVCFECNQLKSDRPLLEFLLRHKLMRHTDVGRDRTEVLRRVEVLRARVVCMHCDRSWPNGIHGMEALWSHECHPQEVT